MDTLSSSFLWQSPSGELFIVGNDPEATDYTYPGHTAPFSKSHLHIWQVDEDGNVLLDTMYDYYENSMDFSRVKDVTFGSSTSMHAVGSYIDTFIMETDSTPLINSSFRPSFVKLDLHTLSLEERHHYYFPGVSGTFNEIVCFDSDTCLVLVNSRKLIHILDAEGITTRLRIHRLHPSGEFSYQLFRSRWSG